MNLLLSELVECRQLTLLSVMIRVSVAIVLGGIIGLERGLKNRPAGLRTYMLVCLGACLVMITNQYIYQTFNTGDPVRMGAQVISGIGFLGAGTIIVTPHSQIKGLTTAAGLWASACVGLAVGIGFYEAAVVGAVGIFTILTVLHILDAYMRRHSKEIEAYVELDDQTTIGDFVTFARRNSVEVTDIQVEHRFSKITNRTTFVVVLHLPKRGKQESVLQVMRDMNGVVCVQPR